jgi:hypothetical protein
MSKGKERGQVIDEQLLVEGIKVNLDPKENDAAKGGNDVNLIEVVSKVEKLTISFKKIAYIENLNGFSNLVKLCLDNNLIENIVNISHLKSLRWLDLSFNRIRKIQGLEELKQLEDLTLYSNKITYLDGLDHLSNLQCLSLGNNRIDSLDQVMKLRSLRNLKMLTLAENPVCKENEYKMEEIISFRPHHFMCTLGFQGHGYSLGFVGLLVASVQAGLIRVANTKLGVIPSIYCGSIFYAIGLSIFAFAGAGWVMYVGLIPYCLSGIGGPSMQGLISGKVPPNAQGELQGALTSTISMAAIIGPPLMTNLYSSFSGQSAPIHFPGAAFIMGMVFSITSLFIAWWNLRKRS